MALSTSAATPWSTASDGLTPSLGAEMSELLEEIQEEFLNANAHCSEVLDKWSSSAAVPVAVVEDVRRKYQRIHVAMLHTLADASTLEGRVEQLNSKLQSIRVQQELVDAAEAGSYQDAVEILDSFREDRDRAAEQASESGHRAAVASLQLQTMACHRDELSSRLSELEDERRAELAPQVKAARDEIDLLQELLHAERLKAAAAQGEVADVAARLEALQLEIRCLGRLAEEEQRAAAQSEKLPERGRREADAAALALRALGAEEEELASRAKELECSESSLAQQAKEATQQQEAAARAGERLHANLGQKAGALEEIAKDIEMAKLEAEKHLAERVTLDLEIEKRGTEAKREAQGLASEQRMRDVALRRLNKTEGEWKAAQGQVAPLENAASSMGGQLASLHKRLAGEGEARAKLQREVEGMVERIATEKNLTELQATLVKASLQDVWELDRESGEVKAMVAKRDKLIQEAASQRDAASRQASQWVAKLRGALEAAEIKDGEVDEMRMQRSMVKVQQKELRGLCEVMSEQMARVQSVCKSAEACVHGLEGKVEAAKQQLHQMEEAAEARGGELRVAETERCAAEAARSLLAGRLGAARRQQAAALEVADHVALEVRHLQRAVVEGQDATRRLQQNKAAAQAAKEAAQQVILGRDDEMCRLYEQSDACQSFMDEGTRKLSRCNDDIRMLQLEVAELQRKLFATQKTAPDVATYDRGIAALKAEVFCARREAEQLSGALEGPEATPGRWRVLPGAIPSHEDLADRMGQIEAKLGTRLNQIAQKDVALDELQRLIDSLVQKAAVSHDGAFQLSVQMNDCQRGLQGMTRRMMATVSELALYQALSLKYAADKEALAAELVAARRNMEEGRPPTAGTDKEFARMERDRAQEAEVRAQAAELRRLKEAGLLGVPQSTASPRPHAYLPDDQEGLPRPFLAPFAPFKPSGAVVAAPRKAAPPSRGATPSPTPHELHISRA